MNRKRVHFAYRSGPIILIKSDFDLIFFTTTLVRSNLIAWSKNLPVIMNFAKPFAVPNNEIDRRKVEEREREKQRERASGREATDERLEREKWKTRKK